MIVFMQRLMHTCVFVQQPGSPDASVLDYMVAQVTNAGLQLLDRLAEVNTQVPLKMQLATMAPSALPSMKRLADMMVARAASEMPPPAALVLADEEEGEQEGQPEAGAAPVEGRGAMAMSGTRTPAGSARADPSNSRTVTETGAVVGVEAAAETGVVTGEGQSVSMPEEVEITEEEPEGEVEEEAHQGVEARTGGTGGV